MASTLLARVTQANERLQNRLKNERMKEQSAARRILSSGAAAAGAATPGVIRGLFGDPNKNGDLLLGDLEVDGALSLGALIVGMAGWLDEASDYAAVYGGAGVGAVLGREIEQSLLAQRRAQGR